MTLNKAWSALPSSSFHSHESANFERATLLSTDSKKTKKKRNDDGNITKKWTSSLEKTSRHYFTEEQDKLILARVKEMGYDNPETWKSLAKVLKQNWPHSLKRRCDLLLRRGSGTLKMRNFTKEEDTLILQKVKEMGYDSIETWKALAHVLNRDPTSASLNVIKGRYDLITNRDVKDSKRFTEEDDNFILGYVEKNGEYKTTWKELATKFGLGHLKSIKDHYHRLPKKYVKRKFTKAEDKVILNYVNVHGDKLQTYKKLGEKLNRMHHNNIRARFEYLQNKPSKKPCSWGIDEDKMLMEHIFQVPNGINKSFQMIIF